jgi:imidazole glycerol-phosphate synthase subunit HisH
MIAVIGNTGANLASVCNALERIGKEPCITNDHERISSATHVILPGVGTAEQAMRRLKEASLTETISNLKQPVLGICLGMQLMASFSMERGKTNCLGIVKASINPLNGGSGLPVPHMGWNNLMSISKDCPIFRGISQNEYFYFVHSYAMGLNSATVASCSYGEQFSAALQFDNFFGVQFHPERSGKAGTQLLRNFCNL